MPEDPPLVPPPVPAPLPPPVPVLVVPDKGVATPAVAPAWNERWEFHLCAVVLITLLAWFGIKRRWVQWRLDRAVCLKSTGWFLLLVVALLGVIAVYDTADKGPPVPLYLYVGLFVFLGMTAYFALGAALARPSDDTVRTKVADYFFQASGACAIGCVEEGVYKSSEVTKSLYDEVVSHIAGDSLPATEWMALSVEIGDKRTAAFALGATDLDRQRLLVSLARLLYDCANQIHGKAIVKVRDPKGGIDALRALMAKHMR